jgi:hypothetical protein
MTAERVSGTRSAHIRPQPRLISRVKLLFKEAKACLAHAPQPRRKKHGGDGTQRGFARAALQVGTLARAMFLHYLPPAFDEGQSIHLWHESNQHDAIDENEPRHQAAQNYLFPHL